MLRLAALMPIALVACVDNGDEGMYVVNNTAVTTACALSGSPDQAFLGRGMIHYASPSAYVMTPLIQSRIASGESDVDEIQRTIQLRGADVTLTLKAVSVERDGQFTVTHPEADLTQFSVLFSGSLPPSGYVNSFVDIIPPATLRQVAQMSGANVESEPFNAEVLAQVVIKGDINGDAIESAPYFYPVSVCNDCVVANLGACPLTVSPRPGNACNPYQDGVVDCCVDASNRLVCPGPM